ncbi:MAG: cupin domain-containing protein [Armatimonadota bacterium]|nr:cupin domain-containing protein [Armatimonadota bacterium]
MTGFRALTIERQLSLDLSGDAFPSQIQGWNDGPINLLDGATHYGIVTHGEGLLTDAESQYPLRAGMFFVLPGAGRIGGRGSAGLVISRHDYAGLWQIGGPPEARGRLRYIDGCSDTLLVCPPLVGEPCLNFLHIPPGTHQTAHTHPSFRAGVILRGRGECRTPDGTFALAPGLGWFIPAAAPHSFHTEGDFLDVIAFHPDSDFGPSHDDHPMTNKTIVNGVPASQIAAIRTTQITS